MTIAGVAVDRLSDEEVVRRVREGEPALFEILMRRHNQRVYRAVRSITGGEEDVEDTMQQAYLNAYLHLDQFAGRARFSTWLTRIAVNEAMSRARRRRMAMETSIPSEPGGEDRVAVLEGGGPTPEHRAFATELRAMLEAAIDRLPQGYREVFVLREVEGLSTAETAECLDLTEEAVKTRLHRARGLLRDYFYERTGASAASAFQFGFDRCDRLVRAVMDRLTATPPGTI